MSNENEESKEPKEAVQELRARLAECERERDAAVALAEQWKAEEDITRQLGEAELATTREALAGARCRISELVFAGDLLYAWTVTGSDGAQKSRDDWAELIKEIKETTDGE